MMLAAQTTNSPGCQGGFRGYGKHPHRPPVAILSTVLESQAGWMDHESVLCLQMRVRVELPPTRPAKPPASRDAAQAQKNPSASLRLREQVLVRRTTFSVTNRKQNNCTDFYACLEIRELILKKVD